jgi:hypothetical protein
MHCKGCWFEEGAKCYHESVLIRDDQGYSKIEANNRCEKYWNKREALSSVIPNEKLIITSERKPT